VNGIEISSGFDGVENASWMDGCFIGGWHIRLISRELKAGKGRGTCAISHDGDLRCVDRGGRRCYTWVSEAMV
jgi:hypothetical protein